MKASWLKEPLLLERFKKRRILFADVVGAERIMSAKNSAQHVVMESRVGFVTILGKVEKLIDCAPARRVLDGPVAQLGMSAALASRRLDK